MHRARDSSGRFIARAKSSVFTTPSTSRYRQDTPPSSPTYTPSPRIPGIQEAIVDSPTPSIESELGRDHFLPSTGRQIVIEEVESPGEEGKEENLSHQPLIEELEDPEEAIMAK